ncbi:MAG: glycosyltransferase family 39 protein [Blastocatellia bacterium]|nr:glycosyltransferase family 39 protein [Blastocatellia bacterium]
MQIRFIDEVDTKETAEASNSSARLNARTWFKDKINSRAFYFTILASAVVLYLALGVGRSLTDSPGCDEGWFASPAFNLATRGHFGTTVLEESNMRMTTGLHQYTYWVMPLNLLAQAAWYEAFGFSLISMRTVSILWGLVALAALFVMLKTLSGDKKVALLAFLIVAVDFAFIRSASSGRMDMMSAALNFAAFAAYLRLRERNFTMALLVGQSFVVASGLTHPNGLLGFAGLLFLILYFDRRNLKLRHLFITAVPFIVGGAAYGLYVINDPRLFLTQLSGNSSGRLWGLASPWSALKFEIAERYIGSGASGANLLKLSLLLAYVAGIAGALSTREIRRHRGYRALLILAAIYFAYFTFFEGTKLYLYLIHIAPLYAAILAAWVRWVWANARAMRWITAPAVCGLILIHLAGSAYVMRRDSYHKSYLPAVAFLNQRSDPQTTITGTAELSFGLTRYDSLSDDKYLGYYSGRRPDLIVVDSRYEEEHEAVRVRQPEIYRHINERLAREYRQVYDHAPYRIYARR